MSKQANFLQESLERLEAGETLESAQQNLPVEEHPSLSLVSRLRAAAWPRRNPHIAEKQRGQIVTLYKQEAKTELVNRPRFEPFQDWRLPVAISVIAVALLVCGLVTISAGIGAIWMNGQQVSLSPLLKGEFTKQVERDEAPELAVEPTELVVKSTESAVKPNEALLSDFYGLVEIWTDDVWQIVSEDTILINDTRLRTGRFSSASLTFNDGSLAQIGPNSEISIETLSVDLANRTREVVLMQWSGDSSHIVVPLDTAAASYRVDTPSASGQVKGTQFNVQVVPEQTVWVVDDGAVEVSGGGAAVQVDAGEMTSVMTDEEPTDPVEFITGQGEVNSIGENWVISGQSYQIHIQTIIIGNPQVGDLVFYEGHFEGESRVADEIVLVHRNPANTFTLTGVVQSKSETWTVNGQEIVVTDQTNVTGDIGVGDLARIKGVILGDGTLQAEEILLITDDNDIPFEFSGVVQEIGSQTWLISNITITVDADTVLDEGLAEGDAVRVQGLILDDGTWLASSITRILDENSAFEFVGYLDGMDPWTVSGIKIDTRVWTAIDADLKLGDLVQVSGQIQPDGSWLAFEIRRFDQALLTILVGRVLSIDPWVVSGLALNVDDETIIEGEIVLGMLVRVEMQLLSNGTHKVVRVTPFDGFDWEMACQSVVVTVTRIDGDQIVLDGWPALSLSEDTQIEGELKLGSVVQTMICYDEDMNVVLVYITVLDNPELPQPPDDDYEDDDDDGDGDHKVTICHKPDKINNTLVIDSSAVPAHLAHGDTLGACSEK